MRAQKSGYVFLVKMEIFERRTIIKYLFVFNDHNQRKLMTILEQLNLKVENVVWEMQSKTANIDDNIVNVYKIILNNGQMKVRKIARAINVYTKSVCLMLNHDCTLHMQTACAHYESKTCSNWHFQIQP